MVMLPNCPEVTQSYGGIWKVGAVIVPVIFLGKILRKELRTQV
jgi:acyl-CoA synthetase (AMP-forming)/AMP-acid ligase II